MVEHLYTVRIDFEDRTFAIEQVLAETPEQALKRACKQSEALADYAQDVLNEMLEHRIILVHLANVRGVWNWHPKPSESDVTAEIYGGNVVQTDKDAPIRSR